MHSMVYLDTILSHDTILWLQTESCRKTLSCIDALFCISLSVPSSATLIPHHSAVGHAYHIVLKGACAHGGEGCGGEVTRGTYTGDI